MPADGAIDTPIGGLPAPTVLRSSPKLDLVEEFLSSPTAAMQTRPVRDGEVHFIR
jgi:hypothetical protein